MLTVNNVNLGSFQVAAASAGTQLTLTLSGTGDMVAFEPLKRCLVAVRSDSSRLGLSEVRIDIRDLYLLNSSCIKALVRFVYLSQTEGPTLSVVFLVNENLSWQARALTPLTRMAPELVQIQA